MNFTEHWCPFEHVNVGHETTKETSPVYAFFPAAPPELEIEESFIKDQKYTKNTIL